MKITHLHQNHKFIAMLFCCIMLTTLSSCTSSQTRIYRTQPENIKSDLISLTIKHEKGRTKPRGESFPIYKWFEPETAPDIVVYLGLMLPLDLVATLAAPFYGYESYTSVTLEGDLHGHLITMGSAPDTIQLEINIDNAGWESATVNADHNFRYHIKTNIDLPTEKQEPLQIQIRLPWQETLAQTGRVARPMPDTFEYSLHLKPDNTLEVIDSHQKAVSSLTIATTYESIKDENRLKELAEEAKERAKRDTLSYKKSEIAKLAKSFAKDVANGANREAKTFNTGWMMGYDPTIPNAIDRYSSSLNRIKWLNAEKTKAKVWVNITVYFSANIARSTGNTERSFLRPFICASDKNGDWQITDTSDDL